LAWDKSVGRGLLGPKLDIGNLWRRINTIAGSTKAIPFCFILSEWFGFIVGQNIIDFKEAQQSPLEASYWHLLGTAPHRTLQEVREVVRKLKMHEGETMIRKYSEGNRESRGNSPWNSTFLPTSA
jgi:hypothetical protein